jgi:hypothetical protein
LHSIAPEGYSSIKQGKADLHLILREKNRNHHFHFVRISSRRTIAFTKEKYIITTKITAKINNFIVVRVSILELGGLLLFLPAGSLEKS